MKIEDRRDYESALLDFKAMLKTKGWKRLLEIGKGQQEVRKHSVILTPLKLIDDALSQEFMKGEYAGIGLLLAIPETEISKFEELIKLNKVEEDDKDGN